MSKRKYRKYNLDDLAKVLADVDTITDAEQIRNMTTTYLRDIPIEDMSEELQCLAVMCDHKRYTRIPNLTPKIKICFLAVFGFGLSIVYDPTEDMKQIAVMNDGTAIRFIKDPSEKVQHLAIAQNPFSIQHIHNPSEAIQIEAVQRNSMAIWYIERPTETVEMLAKLSN